MAWNEPGGNRDPWGNRQNDGPPDLDEVLRRLANRVTGIFGGRRGGGGAGALPGGGGGPLLWGGVLVIAAIGLVLESAYVVQPGEQAVVLRFGSHVGDLQPGISFRLPRPIEFVEKVNVEQVRSISHKASMLTQDENIIDIEMAVQYRVKSVRDYVFNVLAPDATLRQAAETAIREVIGASKMDSIMTDGRNLASVQTRELIQQILDDYGTGLIVDSVNILSVKPPEEVKSAFDDAIKAREDEQRLINEAEAYRKEVLPKAGGAAARIREEAQAYREQVMARATGEAARFDQLREAYQQAPEVTRERLYIEAVESVLSRSGKVLLDEGGGGNLTVLPLDRLLDGARAANPPAAASPSAGPMTPSTMPEPDARPRGDGRERERP